MSVSDFSAGVRESSKKGLGSLESPLPVGDLTEQIKSVLERGFSEVVVVGEISNFKPHPSGHFYFSLKDERAALAAVMFRGENSKIKFQMHDGLKVVAVGRISVYAPRGNYQIIVTRLEPEGLGALQLAFEQLKKKLEAEGLFSPSRKRPLPRFPKCVGIVTAPNGAAIRDMLNVLNRRFAGLHILIYPAKVQGVGAGQEVADGIRCLNAFFPEVDVMIVGRGGGSIEDLWAFNEEVVARAISESKIPVISAVGHEIDFTIADFVADLRAPTPSAAAELVVGSRFELMQHLDHLVSRLAQKMTGRLEFTEMRVDEWVQRLEYKLRDRVGQVHLKFERLRLRLGQESPIVRLKTFSHRLELAWEKIRTSQRIPLERIRWKLEQLEQKLRLLSPLTIMERGYSIVRDEKSGKVIRKVSDVKLGDKLLIQLWKGKISARIQS
jgi:exodeoxyribonuclease VII large subunit